MRDYIQQSAAVNSEAAPAPKTREGFEQFIRELVRQAMQGRAAK